MKQALVLIVVFIIAFGATLLLTGDVFNPVRVRDPIDGAGLDPAGDDALSIRRRAEIERSMIRKGAPEAGKEVAVEAGESASAAVGEVEGEAKTDDGLEPRDLKVSVFPAGPEASLLGGGRFHVANLAPGIYYVGVFAQGYVPRPPAEVTVEAGRKKKIDLWLERGFELAGIVIEDVDQRPIPGASIDFNGLARATSDENGAFRTGIVSPKALDVITVTHDDFDQNRLIHPVMPEMQGITLAMSRGKGMVIGSILPPSGEKVPAQVEVRIWRVSMPGHEELRRERLLRDTSSFEIRGVYGGPHVLEVAFPGTTIVTRRIEFDLGQEPARHFAVDLSQGGRIEGTYTSASRLVAGLPVTLLDLQNHARGETRTDDSGKFNFDRVPAGEYALRMAARIPQIHTESFRVEDGKVATPAVDGQTGRLK